MVPQIEVLKYHRQSGAKLLELFGLRQAVFTSSASDLQAIVIQLDLASVGLFKEIHAAQKCAFTRTTSADKADYISFISMK